ncbi:TonB family protein [Inquilinus sp. Marseille-Q2685]|uniref:TonB family protein n=1 Tax=Inquilinus sp. Marseille-Q2685 TaxID=2866581 RepID=UPI001CE481B6|nr:TonB family protein [Inquilinus sp. Marseille-Q2685]
MTRLRLSGRGIAYAASALIHGGVVVALLPSLTGAAAPTPAETPMVVEMAGFGGPAEAVDTAEPVETAQPEQVEPTEAVPVETAQAEPVETVVEEPPLPAEAPVTETTEIEPPEPAPETPPPELVTTTGQTEAVVAAVPETVQAEEPEIVQPPPTRPKPPAERRPQRQQPRRVQQPAETPPTASQQAALPANPSPPPPPAAAGGGIRSADYAAMLRGHLQRRISRVASMVRESALVTVTVTIELDGTISSAEISRSSGSASVDREILRRVNGASPLPPPPSRISRQPIPFQIDPR